MRLAIILALTLTGCASFSDRMDTLKIVQDAAVAARLTVAPIVDAVCDEALDKCAAALATECPAYESCDKVRDIIARTLQAVHFAIIDAHTAAAIVDSDGYAEAVARAFDLLAQVRKQLAELRILGV
jgi:hypothetical protein